MRLHATILYVAIAALVGTQAWTVHALRAQRQELAKERTRNQGRGQELQVHTARIDELRTTMRQELAEKRTRDQRHGRELQVHATLLDELKTTMAAMRRQQLVELESTSAILQQPGNTLEDVKKRLMQRLGEIASTGQPEAVDEIRKVAERLYEGVDHKREADRTRANLVLIRAALQPLALAAGKGDQGSLQTLLYANRVDRLRSSVLGAVGTAAAMGNRQALEELLNYHRHDWLLSSTVFALQDAAKNGVPEAVDFLINVVDDNSRRALWRGATQGLTAAATDGNQRAQAALDKYAAYKEARRRERKNTQAD